MKYQYCIDGLVVDVSRSRGSLYSSPPNFLATVPFKLCLNERDKNRDLISVDYFQLDS